MCGVSNIAYAKADGLFVPDDTIPHEKAPGNPWFFVVLATCDVYYNGKSATEIISAPVSALIDKSQQFCSLRKSRHAVNHKTSSDRFYTYRVIQVSV